VNFAIWKRIIRTPYGAALGFCILLQGLLAATFSPLLPLIVSDRIGMDKPQLTVFFVVVIFVGTVVTLVTGYLSDGMIARYKLVAVGGCIAVLGNIGIATATQPLHMFMAGIALEGVAVFFPQLFAVAKAGVLGDWSRDDQVVGITAFRTLFSLGFIIGTATASWLVQVMDIQAAFFPIAVGGVILTICSVMVLYQVEGRITAKAVDTPASESEEARGVTLPFYALIVPLVALIVLEGADSTRTVYLTLVMFQRFKDASIAPLMFGISATAELVTMGLIGSLASKIGEKNAIFGGALVGSFCFIVLAFAQPLSILYAIQPVYAVFVAALQGVAMAYIQGLLTQRAGLGGALFMAVFNIGALVGILSPLLVTGYTQTVFTVPAVLCVAGGLLLMFGDRTAQIQKRLRSAAQPDTPVPAPAITSG
jgi:MFS transporter, SET family, sugar efflux transporter